MQYIIHDEEHYVTKDVTVQKDHFGSVNLMLLTEVEVEGIEEELSVTRTLDQIMYGIPKDPIYPILQDDDEELEENELQALLVFAEVTESAMILEGEVKAELLEQVLEERGIDVQRVTLEVQGQSHFLYSLKHFLPQRKVKSFARWLEGGIFKAPLTFASLDNYHDFYKEESLDDESLLDDDGQEIGDYGNDDIDVYQYYNEPIWDDYHADSRLDNYPQSKLRWRPRMKKYLKGPPTLFTAPDNVLTATGKVRTAYPDVATMLSRVNRSELTNAVNVMGTYLSQGGTMVCSYHEVPSVMANAAEKTGVIVSIAKEAQNATPFEIGQLALIAFPNTRHWVLDKGSQTVVYG